MRLQRLHSHWYCRARRAVLLLPLYFLCREVQFFLEYGGPAEVTASWGCWRVPQTMWAMPWAVRSLMKAGLDRLVLRGLTVAATVQQNFERGEYTHTYVSPEGAMRVAFPRYKLEFESRGDSRFHSMNYAGYRLAARQQLEDTLMQFREYLLLEHVAKGSDNILVLVPAGRVSLDRDGVSISVSETSDAARSYHVYDVHPRIRHLKARDPLRRLRLAALCAVGPCTTMYRASSYRGPCRTAPQCFDSCKPKLVTPAVRWRSTWRRCYGSWRAPLGVILAAGYLRL